MRTYFVNQRNQGPYIFTM